MSQEVYGVIRYVARSAVTMLFLVGHWNETRWRGSMGYGLM